MKIVKRWTAKAKEQVLADIINNKDNLPDVFNYDSALIYLRKIREQQYQYEVNSTAFKLANYAYNIVKVYINWYNLKEGNITFSLCQKGYNSAKQIEWKVFLNKDIEETKALYKEHNIDVKYPPIDL